MSKIERTETLHEEQGRKQKHLRGLTSYAEHTIFVLTEGVRRNGHLLDLDLSLPNLALLLVSVCRLTPY